VSADGTLNARCPYDSGRGRNALPRAAAIEVLNR
jgi:hypothetical protein